MDNFFGILNELVVTGYAFMCLSFDDEFFFIQFSLSNSFTMFFIGIDRQIECFGAHIR